jgi:predicted dehydrogenase
MSDTIRLGFVGAGYMGQLAHIQNYWKLQGVELTALAEGRSKTAELVARTYGIREIYPHHSKLLANAPVDAIVAILPFALNAEVVEDALNAGKHILTEKPIVLTSARGHELVALAAKKNLVYQVGYMKRFDPAVRWAKAKLAEWRNSGKFGALQSLRIWCATGDWQWQREKPLDAGDAPAQYAARLESKPDWMSDATWESHIHWANYYSHQTNLARFIVGEDYAIDHVKTLSAPDKWMPSYFIQCSSQPSGASVYLDFPRFHHNQWDEGFEVILNRAKMRVTLPAPLAQRQIAQVTAYEFHPNGESREIRPTLTPIDGFAAQAKQFIASIRGEEPPLSPASDAVKEIEFSEALMKKLQHKQSP